MSGASRTAVFFDPYLATAGGGEAYFLSIAARAHAAGYGVRLISPQPPDPATIARLGVDLPIDAVQWVAGGRRRAQASSRDASLFVALANTLIPAPLTTRSLVVLQFPWLSPASANPVRSALGRRQGEHLAAFEHVVCYSEFVAACIRERFPGCQPVVIPPPVTLRQAAEASKGTQVLAVGRFFAGRRGNNKKHAFMIDAWRRLTAEGHALGWTLHLAGGCTGDARSRAYLQGLRRRATDLNVRFHVNVPRDELSALYDQSSIFWHAAGVGETRPERFEHFGISTVEAMAAGCVPVVVALGGQAEIVRDHETGLLWRDEAELVSATATLIRDPAGRSGLSEAARAAAQPYGADRFAERVDALIGALD